MKRMICALMSALFLLGCGTSAGTPIHLLDSSSDDQQVIFIELKTASLQSHLSIPVEGGSARPREDTLHPSCPSSEWIWLGAATWISKGLGSRRGTVLLTRL